MSVVYRDCGLAWSRLTQRLRTLVGPDALHAINLRRGRRPRFERRAVLTARAAVAATDARSPRELSRREEAEYRRLLSCPAIIEGGLELLG